MAAAWCDVNGRETIRAFFGLHDLKEHGLVCRNTKSEVISTHMPVYPQGNFAEEHCGVMGCGLCWEAETYLHYCGA